MDSLPEIKKQDPIPNLLLEAKNSLQEFENNLSTSDSEIYSLEVLNEYEDQLSMLETIYKSISNVSEVQITVFLDYILLVMRMKFSSKPLYNINSLEEKENYIRNIEELKDVYGKLTVEEFKASEVPSTIKKYNELMNIISERNTKVHLKLERVPSQIEMYSKLLRDINKGTVIEKQRNSIESHLKFLPVQAKILDVEDKILNKLFLTLFAY